MSRAASAKDVLREEVKKLEKEEKKAGEDLEENVGMQAQLKQMLGGKLDGARDYQVRFEGGYGGLEGLYYCFD